VRAATERLERRKKHAKIFEAATELRNAKGGRGSALKRRFWKSVGVEEVDGKPLDGVLETAQNARN
jgi:ATP synthase F1 complex assembly factor 2